MHRVNQSIVYCILTLLSALLIAGCSPTPEDDTKLLTSTLKRAEAYADQGQYKAAVIEARNALRMAPNSIDAIMLASRINIDLGQPKSALDLLEPLKSNPDTTLRLLLAKAYLMRGKKRSALEYLANTTTTTAGENDTKTTLLFRANLLSNNYSDAASNLATLKSRITDADSKANYHYSYSTLLFKQNKLSEAQEEAEKALIAKPSHTDSLLISAAIAFRNQDLEKSETLLSDALLSLTETDVLLPQKTKVLQALIDVLTARGRSSEALIYTRLLAQNNPGASEQRSKLNEALELYRSGSYDEAEKLLLEVNNVAPNSKSKQLLGLLSLKKGNLDEAESLLSEGFDPEIANNQSLSLLARTRLGLRQPSKVIAMLKEEVKARENNSEILALYGLASLAEGNEKEGITALTKAIAISPEKHRLRIAMADYYSANNKPKLALKHLEEAYAKAPSSASIQKRLLKHYLTHPYTTEPKFYSAYNANTNDPQLNFLVGSLEHKNGQPQKAREHFARAIKLDPKSIDATFALALLNLVEKRLPEAQELFSAGITLVPDNSRAYKGLADAILRQGNESDLIPTMLKLADQHPASTGPDEVLSEYYLKQRDLDKALTHAKAAHSKNPKARSAIGQSLKIHNYRTQKAISESDYTAAREELMQALQIEPNNTLFLAELIGVEIADNRIIEAKKILGQIKQTNPEGAITNSLASDIAFKEGALEDALKFSDIAWEKSKSPIVARKRYNMLKQSDPPTAIQFLDIWISAIEGSAEPLKIKGSSLLGMGEYKSAIQTLEKALAISPNDPVTLNNLAWLYQETKDPRSLETAAKAHSLAPKNGGIADTYGWILVQDGQLKLGIKKLELASTLAPNNKEIQEHLAQAKSQ